MGADQDLSNAEFARRMKKKRGEPVPKKKKAANVRKAAKKRSLVDVFADEFANGVCQRVVNHTAYVESYECEDRAGQPWRTVTMKIRVPG
jgi:hypothetical protein